MTVGIDCKINRKNEIEHLIFDLSCKLNEVIIMVNTLTKKQDEFDKINKEMYMAIKSIENLQLDYLNGIVLKAPNGNRYILQVNNLGGLEIVEQNV